jgi:hypothetical protein
MMASGTIIHTSSHFAFFQRFNENKTSSFLYAAILESQAKPQSQSINLGLMPLPGSSAPAI